MGSPQPRFVRQPLVPLSVPTEPIPLPADSSAVSPSSTPVTPLPPTVTIPLHVSVSARSNTHDAEWLLRALEHANAENLQAKAEVQGVAERLRQLIQTLLPEEVEEQSRQSRQFDKWSVPQLINFIERYGRAQIERNHLSCDPELPQKHNALTAELSQLRKQVIELGQDLQARDTMIQKQTGEIARLGSELYRARRDSHGSDDKRNDRKRVGMTEPVPIPRFVPLAANTISPTLPSLPVTPVVSFSPPTPQPSVAQPETLQGRELTKQDRGVIEAMRMMAETGMCRGKRIREYLAETLGGREKNFTSSLKRGVTEGYLEIETAQTSWRGNHDAQLFRLTPLGRQQVKQWFGIEPVESELARGLRFCDTASDLYLILEVQETLSFVKYEKVEIFNAPINFSDDSTYTPDILAVHPNGTRLVIEVERDVAQDFGELTKKYTRAALVNNGILYLILANAQVAQSIGRLALQIAAEYAAIVREVRAFNFGGSRTGQPTGDADSIWKQLTDEMVEQFQESDTNDEDTGKE